MNQSTLAAPLPSELKAEASHLLNAHIVEYGLQVLEEITHHYPAILKHFADPVASRPDGVPEWLYCAAFEATDADRYLCWPVFRGSLLSRVFSLTSGCRISGASRALKEALLERKATHGHDGDPAWGDEAMIECVAITGTGLARALGESLYRLVIAYLDELERRTKIASVFQP